MRSFAGFLAVVAVCTAQSDPSFSGTWKLNTIRSEIRSLPQPPDPVLKVEQSDATLTLFGSSGEGGPANVSTYPLDRRTEKRAHGGFSTSTATKWEGSVLLVNTLVSGPQNYTVMERWRRSRDGYTLTITRTIVRPGSEVESVLVYESPDARSSVPRLTSRSTENVVPRVDPVTQPIPAAAAPAPEAPKEYVVEAGTRILLRLTNSVHTKHTAVGDRVYLETAVPVYVNGRLAIPRGSYVTGTVTESHPAGRVKGKSALSLEFVSLTFVNGVHRDLRSRLGSVDTRGNLDRTEGKIEGEGNKGGDASTVGKTTAAGAGVGSVAGAASGHLGMGAGIGAAAGAAAGLAGVFGSRGPDVVLPQGTTMELVLDRDLRFTDDELRAAIQ